jgi:hypothetical protein
MKLAVPVPDSQMGGLAGTSFPRRRQLAARSVNLPPLMATADGKRDLLSICSIPPFSSLLEPTYSHFEVTSLQVPWLQ